MPNNCNKNYLSNNPLCFFRFLQGQPELVSFDESECKFSFHWASYVACKPDTPVQSSNCQYSDQLTSHVFDFGQLGTDDSVQASSIINYSVFRYFIFKRSAYFNTLSRLYF